MWYIPLSFGYALSTNKVDLFAMSTPFILAKQKTSAPHTLPAWGRGM